MTTVDLKDYKELYISTAKEYIDKLKKNLEPTSLSTENIDELHLSAHSLKSQSLVMGFNSTGTLCFKLEKLFKEIKETNGSLNPEVRSMVETSIEALEKSIESIKQTNKELNLSSEIEKIK